MDFGDSFFDASVALYPPLIFVYGFFFIEYSYTNLYYLHDPVYTIILHLYNHRSSLPQKEHSPAMTGLMTFWQ